MAELLSLKVTVVTGQRYHVWDVSSWTVAGEEAAGGEEKAWLTEPKTGCLWLFKPVTSHDWRSDQGEDWAERVVAEVATQLGLPCARVELGQRGGRRGSLSQKLRPTGWELHHGAVVVLAEIVPGYRQGASNPRGRPGHSVPNIQRALSGLQVPPGTDVASGFGAFDVFAGYLMLDALVANRDRHDDNWAVLRPVVGTDPPVLAGSYDHAGSLGYNLTDGERERHLREGSVEQWVRKGTAWRFEHDRKPATLVEIAAQGLATAQPAARSTWLDQLRRLDVKCITSAVRMVPGLSDIAASFSIEVMCANRRRLLDEC